VRIDFDPARVRRGAPPDVAILADARVALAAGLSAKSPQAAVRTQAIAKVKAEVAAEFDRSVAPQMSFLRAFARPLPKTPCLSPTTRRWPTLRRLPFLFTRRDK
jgi:acetolactate synthase I/II/III large subunit